MDNRRPVYVPSYALMSDDGRYYTGKAGSGWLGKRSEAFTYSRTAAYNKQQQQPFKQLTVLKGP